MKIVTAIIKPFKLEEVRDALTAVGVHGPAELLDQVVDAITATARTGQIGDGKIFVTTLEQAVRIRTGETDADAL